MKIRTFLLLSALASALAAGPARADHGAGTVEGTVSDDGLSPLSGICVTAFDEWWGWAGWTETDAAGRYAIELPEGTYKLSFEDCNSPRRYLSEWYDEKADFESADAVIVTSDAATVIDESLALGGSVSGRVTAEDTGAPLRGVCVRVVTDDFSVESFGSSDDTGAYVVGALPSGPVKVWFGTCAFFVPRARPAPASAESGDDASRYVPEWWNDRASIDLADPVPVAVGVETPGIDAALALGGTISGVVTNAEGTGLQGICVEAFSLVGDRSSAYTDGRGSYLVVGLRTGDHKVLFSDCWGSGYLDEWYDDKGSELNATPVPVTQPLETPGIDAVLRLRPRPDMAVRGLEVTPEPIRTDYGNVGYTGWVRRVDVDLGNLGDAVAEWVTLSVWARSDSDERYRFIGGAEFDTVAPGARLRRTFTWNALGAVGDATVVARVCAYDDPHRENDVAAARHYSVVGGTGVGLDPLGGRYPPDCGAGPVAER